MVASAALDFPHPPPAEWMASRQSHQVLLTVGDVDAMMRAGIIPEDCSTELLHGVLQYTDRSALGDVPIRPTTGRDQMTGFILEGSEIVEGVDHNFVVAGLTELAAAVNTPARHLRTQSTLICTETHAPIPDAVVLRGPRTEYRLRRPTAADAICVVEVSNSTYEKDAGEKLFGYAKGGIPQYVIINLRNRTAEVYADPDPGAGTYAPPSIVPAEGVLSLRVGDAGEMFVVPLADLLP